MCAGVRSSHTDYASSPVYKQWEVSRVTFGLRFHCQTCNARRAIHCCRNDGPLVLERNVRWSAASSRTGIRRLRRPSFGHSEEEKTCRDRQESRDEASLCGLLEEFLAAHSRREQK